MDGQLKVVITADNKAAIAALNNTDRALNKTADIATRTGSAIAKSSNTAGNAITNLGRIAQDAPFGFIGIQNNLNPLLESFQRLKTETGSTGGALKALAGSLIGPAGLGLALSVGSALILTFGDKLTELLGITFGVTEEQKKLNKAIDGFKNSAAEEIIKFKELTSVAANANIPLNQRKDAVEQLQKNYPAYLGNLSQEDLLSGKIGKAYDEVVTALKAKIALQAAEQKLIPIIKEQLDIAEKIAEAQKVIDANQKDKVNTTEADIKAQQKFARETGKGAVTLLGASDAAAKAAQKTKEELTPAYDALENKIKSAFSSMQPFIAASNGLNFTLNNQKEEVDQLKKALDEYIKTLMFERTLQQQGMRKVEPRTRLGGDYSTPEINIPKGMEERTVALQNLMKTQLDYANSVKLSNMQEAEAYQIATMATSAFTDLGNALLMGQDLGSALGNVFRKLAIDIGAAALKALVFKSILGAITGGASTGVDAATGGGFGSLFGSIFGGRAIGGVTQGPKSGYPMMLHGTEAVLTPHQMTGIINQSMNAGAMQGMSMNNQMGGGSFVLRGNDLVLALQRSNYALNLRRG